MQILHSKKLLFASLLLSCCSFSVQAKELNRYDRFFQTPAEKTYTGKLIDLHNQPLSNATVKVIRTEASTKTNRRGEFSIQAQPGDSLQISLPGYKDITYGLTDATSIDISMREDDAVNLKKEQAVELIYTKSPPHLAIGSSDAVYNEELVKNPVTSIRNALTGRMSGLVTYQFSGQPGNDGVVASLRGQTPLIIIDGVARNLTIFDLEEVESVTAIKDGLGAAMLGVRGSNGALLITTRKGKVSKQQISFTAQTAFQQPTLTPKPLNAFDYATLRNEAVANEAKVGNDYSNLLYNQTALDGYKNHSDPYLYPDVDWQKELLKKSSRFDRYTLSATGGNNFARYFVSMEHLNQTGLFIQSDKNKYSTNNTFKSYVLRSNVDIDINKKLSAGIYLLGRILNGNEPGAFTGNVFGSLLLTPNNAYPITNPDGSYGGTQQYQNNLKAQLINSGYRMNYKRDMLVDVYLKRTLDEITPGLWLRLQASYYATLSENISRNKSFAVFQRNISPTGAVSYTQFGTNGDQANGNGIEYQGRTDYVDLRLGYNRVFNKKHGIDGLLLVNRDNAVSGSDLPYTISGGSGRLAYNYDEKYVAEFAFGYNGSNWYGPKGDTKRGFFPAGGLAWNISKEKFMSKLAWLNHLKIFGSVGQTGWDNPGYFTYIQRYFDGATTYFGTGAGGNTSIAEQPLANPDLSWEKAVKVNLGVQGTLLNNQLTFSAEYYTDRYYDLLMQRGRNSTIIGNTYPNENIGRNRYMGWDFQLGWQQSKKNFSYYLNGNASIQNSEVLFMDEVFRPYPWMQRTGRRVSQPFGYIAEGLYQNQGEINASPAIEGFPLQPGDIKYKDLNGDGIINQFDQAPIGSDKPLLFYGLSGGANYKGFDFSFLVQGIANRQVYMSGNSYYEFQNNGFGQAYAHNLERWTATNTNAKYPRASIGVNINNHATSSFWYQNGSYLRIKNLELGYTLSSKLTNRARLQSARLFVSATNYFTITSLKDRDPEVFNGLYPLQKLINLGLNIKL